MKTSTKPASVTVVMYHYVRPLEQTRFPAIKALRVDEFRRQLDHIRRHYHPVRVADIAAALSCAEPLPPNAILLTFDDGYLDHFQYVFPILHAARIEGAFFPPADAIRHGRLLDVNRIHYLLASGACPSTVIEEINDAVRLNREIYSLADPSEYWHRWAKPSRFDPAETVYIKRMLQVALPEALRSTIAESLFRKFVTTDEVSFARELYMDMDQLAMLARCGMYVGSHGVSHRWLDSIGGEEQQREIDESLSFLREIGSPVDDYWVMCYPYGASNQPLRELLARRACSFAVTVAPGVAELTMEDRFLLPRIDTNDLPK